MAEEYIKHPFVPGAMAHMPSLCFLLKHSK